MRKIAVIHTSLAIRESVDAELKRVIPDCDIHNLIDEKMLQDVVDNGGLNASLIRRMNLYVSAAEAMGADIILNACSSVGAAFDLARRSVSIPTLRIDEPMAEAAVAGGGDIAVYGTVATTLKPSSDLIASVARRSGKSVEVTPFLVDGAFDVLSREKNVEKHNRMVLERIHATHGRFGAIVLAQASMTVLIPYLQDLGKPVFYSLQSGVARVKELTDS